MCLENEWLKKENIVDVNATHVKSSGEIFSKTDMKGWVEIKDGSRKLISEKKKIIKFKKGRSKWSFFF